MEMCTRSPASPTYGSGINVIGNATENTTIHLMHAGAGFGFRAYMEWHPEYGIGCLVLTNSEHHGNSPEGLGSSVLRKLIIEKKLVEKRYPFDIPSPKAVEGEKGKIIAYQPPVPNSFTSYKSALKKYVGTYSYMMSGWKLRTYARIGLVCEASFDPLFF